MIPFVFKFFCACAMPFHYYFWMFLRRLAITIGMLLVCLTAPAVFSAETVHLQVLVDPAGTLTIDEVSSAARASEFRDVSGSFAGGYSRKVHWFRMTLDAPHRGGVFDAGPRLLLEAQPPYLDDVRLFLPQPGRPGYFVQKTAGDIHPYSDREVPGRNFVFSVDFPDDRPQTLYLRLETTSSSLLFVRAWQNAEFVAAQTREYLVLGLYYGLLLAVLLLNLWHGQWREEAAYRNFMAYLTSVILLMLGVNGLVSEYLLADFPLLAHHWVSVFVFVSLALAARFHRSILEIDKRQPLLNAYFLSLAWLPVLLAPAALLGYFPECASLLMTCGMISPVLGIIRSLALWRQKRAGSQFLILANAASLSGYTYSMFGLLGITGSALTQLYGIQLSSLISLLAFNFVLMSQLRHLQRERTLAQKAAEQAQSAHLAVNLVRQRQGALLSMLIHELKTPLGVIRLALDRLGGDELALRHANTAVSDISAVVDRCMKADKLDQGIITVKPSPCDMVMLLRDIRTKATEPIRIELEAPLPLPSLRCDPLLLRTIVANLIDNALKYSPAGSRVTLRVVPLAHAEEGSAGIQLTIENQKGSTGLPDPGRLFERYYRSPGAHAKTGSGLGLFIARQLANRLGGSLSYILPMPDGKIRFSLWLPLLTHE